MNRQTNHRTVGIVETDMSALADARAAVTDLNGWLLSLPFKRRTTPDDVQRLADGLHRITAGLDTVEKYLRHLRAEGWPPSKETEP